MAADDWAVVVGVRSYPDLGHLDGPENDAQAFYQWVTAPGGGRRTLCLTASPPLLEWRRGQPLSLAVRGEPLR